MKSKLLTLSLLYIFFILSGVGCGSNGSQVFTIGGTVSGLSADLVLQNNGSDDLTINTDGVFTFSTSLAAGTTYSVTVATAPAGQTCTVANGTGTATGDVDNILVTCSSIIQSYTLGGTISGLSGTLILKNSDEQTTSITDASSFQFANALVDGSSYEVTVQTQPTNQTCTVANDSGTMSGANVTNITVTCSTNTHTVGGTVSGLSGTVTLQNNSTNSTSMSSDGSFTFSTPVAEGSSYNVTVQTQPADTEQTCTVTNGSGTIGSSNVTNVDISCGPSVPRFAYVTQYDSNNGIVVCEVDPINGLLSDCGDVGAHDVLDGIFPQGISINSTGTIAYITAYNDLPYTYQCTINRNDGTFSACSAINITTPSNYDTQYGKLTLNASDTTAFIANSDTTASILACPIIDGSISQTCSNTGAILPVNATPVGIVLNSTNTVSYFGNYVVNNVTQCIVSGSGFSSCSNKTGDGIINFSNPAGTALTSNDNIIYIADSSTPNVYGCETTPNGPSEFSHCFIATTLGSSPWGITLNAQETMAYVTGYGTTVSVCPILSDGTFPICTGVTGFSSAVDVSLLY